jgi:hypothetical protein
MRREIKMTGQPVVEPPVLGQGQKTPMRRLRRLWVLLTIEEIFHEDGTTARVTRVRTAIRS